MCCPRLVHALVWLQWALLPWEPVLTAERLTVPLETQSGAGGCRPAATLTPSAFSSGPSTAGVRQYSKYNCLKPFRLMDFINKCYCERNSGKGFAFVITFSCSYSFKTKLSNKSTMCCENNVLKLSRTSESVSELYLGRTLEINAAMCCCNLLW